MKEPGAMIAFQQAGGRLQFLCVCVCVLIVLFFSQSIARGHLPKIMAGSGE